MSRTTETPRISRRSLSVIGSVADTMYAADLARIDWEHDADTAGMFLRSAGRDHLPEIRDAVHNMFGIGAEQRIGKLARTAAVKRNKGRALSKSETEALATYNRVSQSWKRAKEAAFGVAKVKRAAHKVTRLPRGAKELIGALRALGVSVKVTAVK